MITKFIRKYLMNGYVSIPLMLCFILASWGSIANNKKLTYHLTGEEMFRGVFFVEGQYAEMIPELKAAKTTYFADQLTTQENAALSAVRNQIIESIKADNPAYFDEFKFALQTASPEIVKEKIVEAQALLTEKAMSISKVSESELKEDVKATEAFLAKQGNNVDKNALKKFMNQMAKDNSSPANVGTGACIAILILVVVLLIVVVVAFAEEMAANSSNLMLEQVAGSICTAAPSVV
jgi:SdpC family antimicrobial peptide